MRQELPVSFIMKIIIIIAVLRYLMEGGQAKHGFIFERKPNNDIYLTPTAEHKYTLLWMHGLGDSSDGFLDFFFTSKSIVPNQNTKVILLNAPKQPVTCNGGFSMNSWYDILELRGPNVKVDEASITASTDLVL
jgi:phospholipase/carboxylesterase